MRRLVAHILALWFIVLGTGAVQHLHQWEHRQSATECAHQSADHHHETPGEPSHHDDDCPLCVQLHQPLVIPIAIPAFLATALLVETRSVVDHALPKQSGVMRLDCRGPPHRSPLFG